MVINVESIISSIALILSGWNAWHLFLRKGKIKTTQPALIAFGPDDPVTNKVSKIFIRTLLFCNAPKGLIIESMYIKLHQGDNYQVFNQWITKVEDIADRGCGLYIDQEGVTLNHHFLVPADGTEYTFKPGPAAIKLYVNILGRKKVKLLSSIELSLSEADAEILKKGRTWIHFDWAPETKSYNKYLNHKKLDSWDLLL